MTQLRFAFGEAVERENARKRDTDRARQAYSADYCFRVITQDSYLWDMRCWQNYHDHEEVLEWISGDTRAHPKNAGHCAFCIEVLKSHGVSLDKIANAILENDHIQYKNRLVACWHDPGQCSKYEQQGHYGNNMCAGCQNNADAD